MGPGQKKGWRVGIRKPQSSPFRFELSKLARPFAVHVFLSGVVLLFCVFFLPAEGYGVSAGQLSGRVQKEGSGLLRISLGLTVWERDVLDRPCARQKRFVQAT